MALDLAGVALDFDPATLLDSVAEVHDKGWKSISGRTSGVTLVRALEGPPGPGLDHDSIYARLEKAGVLCIAGAAANGKVLLSGGSISACCLELGGRLQVVKEVEHSPLQRRDGIERHMAEAQWMAATNSDRPGLFPEVEASRSNGMLSIRSDFFPAYTLGELYAQGRLDAQAAQGLIGRAFATAASHLYGHSAAGDAETYVAKVRRRLHWLLQSNASPPLVAELFHRGARINGRACRPISDLLDLMESDARLAPMVRCERPRFCHGDFIPEDILYSAASDRMQFIDPNPQVRDPLADVGKMVMSCLLNYDLAIRDQVRIGVDQGRDGAVVATGEAQGWDDYIGLQKRILIWVLENSLTLVGGSTVEDHRLGVPSILLHAGLQAMALTVFHHLHHHKEQRALYFLAKGHVVTEAAVATLQQAGGQRASLQDLQPF